jgi:disulfide bond formation protein DsbB
MTETPPDLAARYLDELERLLTHADPDERADVLAAVREHIEAALAEQTARGLSSDVASVLAGLGSPEEVAGGVHDSRAPDGALGGRAGDFMPPVPSEGPGGVARTSALAGTWVAPVACLLLIVGALTSVVIAPLVLWLAGAILMAASPLWQVREKVIALVVSPAGVVVFSVAATLSFGSTSCMRAFDETGKVIESTGSCSTGVQPGAWIGLGLVALLVVSGFAYVVVLWRRGAARSQQLLSPETVRDTVRR